MSNAVANDREICEVWYCRLSRFLPWTALPWMIVSYVSIMAGGAPGVVIGPFVWFLLIVLWTYPVTAFAGVRVAKLFHRKGNQRYAAYSLLVPAALGVIIVALMMAPFAYGLFLYGAGQL